MGEDKRASLDALCNIPISISIRTFSYDYILITKISYMSLYGSKRNACVDTDLFGGDFWVLSYLTKHNTFFIIKACKIACCYDFIRNSLPNGLDTRLGQSGGNVSGGQRQRLCIARALLRQPKILVLDDSFSALDRITEAQLKKNLEECYPERTKIVISQKTSTIEDSDRIIVLKDGKINNIGTSSWLLDHDPIYQDIYKVQKEGLEK